MATYARPFIRLTAHGRLFTTETFSVSLNVATATGSPAEPTQAQVDAAAAAWQALWIESTNPLILNYAKLIGVKAALIGTDGHYVSDAPVEAVLNGSQGVPGGGSGVNAPQVALAVTLEGARPRGAAGRGRFYLPAPAQLPQADGRIAATSATAYAQAAVTLINTINSTFGGSVSIVGPATATGRGAAVQQVTAVRVGRVLDTIRSRRTSMPEEPVYATTAVNETAGGGF